MHLLEYVNYEVVPTPEAMLVRPIREMYLKDKSKNKDEFFKKISVIYFMADPRSSYNYIIDEKVRLEEIVKQEGLPADFKITKELGDAIEIYKKHVITTSYLILQDSRIAIDKIREFLRNVDLKETDEKGRPLYTVDKITSTIKQIPQLVKDLSEAERVVAKEIEEEGRARGGNDKKHVFEDGIPV